MREPTLIIWALLAFITGLLFMWSVRHSKRQLGKYVAIHKLALILASFGAGFLAFFFLKDSPHQYWASRLSLLFLGLLHTWAMYSQSWVKRDKYDYEKDSFLPEFLFTLLQALIASACFTISPQLFGVVERPVDVSLPLWDAPLAFMAPFLVLKIGDYASQIPFRAVENPWVYPIEPVNPENWPMRNLMQVNFQVRRSLVEEYHLFRRAAFPWIEAPKEIPLGDIFRLVMQERRRRPDLLTIQDMGDEYGGDPKFWWLFSIKKKWWDPGTWYRSPRYLNPDQSVTANKVQKNDIIIARRIPGDGSKFSYSKYQGGQSADPDRTRLIHR